MPNKRMVLMKRSRHPRKPSHSIVREANVMSGFPRTHRVKLTYAESIAITGSAGVMNTGAQYRANGAWDPLVAAGGTTPFNYTVWAKMYNHYTVMSSRITFRIGSSGADSTVTTGIYLADDGNLPYTTPGGIIGARRGTYKVLPHWMAAPCVTHASYDPKVMYSLPIPENNEAISSKTSGLPQDQTIYFVWTHSSVASHVEGVIEIEYDVLFKEPTDAIQ